MLKNIQINHQKMGKFVSLKYTLRTITKLHGNEIHRLGFLTMKLNL